MERLPQKSDSELHDLAEYYGITVPPNISRDDLVNLINNRENIPLTNPHSVPTTEKLAPLRINVQSETVNIQEPQKISVRKTVAQKMTLPLKSDLQALNEVRTGLVNIQEINPNATFQNNQPISAPQPPSTKQTPMAILPRLTIPQKIPPVATPKLALKLTVPTKTPQPKLPIRLITPQQKIPVQPSKLTLKQPPGSLIKTTIAPITQLVMPTQLPASAEVVMKIPLPVIVTRVEMIPLPEATEPTAQPTMAYTAEQMAVLGMASIDPARLTPTRSKESNTKFYSVDEMKAIARSFGLRSSGNKAELYERIMKRLQQGGYVNQ